MSKILLLFLSLTFLSLDCEVYKDRPKIKTDNGDLILEPAFDKNIYLRPNGPQSAVFVGDINILNVNTSQIISDGTSTDKQTPITLGRILERLDKLEKQVNDMNPSLNLSLIWQKLSRQATVIHRLRNAIRDGVTGDKCEPRPCQNGGTCLSLVNDYHCLCPSNWEGKDCNLDVNECRNFAGTDLGCQNGATCINRPGSYECLCRSGWFGLHCTRKAKDCLGSGGGGDDFEMCGHGTCIPVQTGVGIKCICDQGWTTNGTDVSCSTDINECESKQGPHCSVNPKVNCINLPGSFRCEACPAGYEGDGYVCSDIDECTTTPNGGCSTSPMVTCHNTIGSRTCGHCPPGYVGDGVTCAWRGTCKINHGGCHPSAQCFESPAQTGGQIAQCVCPVGMEGDGVGVDGCYISPSNNITQNCENNPCGPHGRCHQLTQGYTCLCMRGYGGAHCNSMIEFCSSNPCQNGGVCRPDETKIRGFRCECTARFSGDVCHIPTKTCGGFLDGQEGSITYPLTNSSYSHNSRCAWVIHTSSLKVINVTFSKFDIEDNPDCSYDFLQIHDGRSSASQLLGRFCGKTFPKGGNIVSSHNYLYFWFRSDESGARTGFSLHWTSIDPVCGGELDAKTHGHISSPGSPGKYPPNRDCYWHITTSLGKRIQLHFFEFDIEAHKNCSFDYVAIYDGEHITDPLINKYCNSSQPAPIQSAGSEILVHFHSDGIGSGNGFQISYATVEGVPGCGGLYTGEKGEISSPTYEGKYIDNLLCDYEIKAPPGSKILIKFKSFKLETSFQCKYDYLKMYDGPNTDSQLVGRFCGLKHPQSYTSTSNSIFIQFKSDHSLNSDGFHITYEIICQHYITGDSGVIKSPGYPFNYTENKVCEYIVSTAPGKAIQLTFRDFDIEDNKYFNCQYDYVELRDGPDKNSTLMGRFCGSEPPQVQTSSLNYMYIRFNSDMSVSGTGFYANFTTIDIKCGGIHKDATGLISHPIGSANTYEKDQTCTWYLIAPPGQRIKLTWNRFEIEGTPSCHSDYLELTEIDLDNTEHSMPKFCGSSAPPTMTTASNRLKINFRSDSSVESAGFSMSYTFLDEKSHCGGIYFRSHGYIYSPGWPQRYEPNRNCVWTITAPFGQQIRLNFSRFNLERPIRNSCDLGDYLEIRNGVADNSPLVGSYCGDNAPKMITSTGNSIYLKFHSDYYFSGAGFQIEWDGTLFGCGGTLTGSKGSITSPNYPLPYNENAECFYRIVTSHGSRIKLIFNDLDLEKTHGCTDDYVEIFDGRDSNALSLGRYCSMTLNSSNIETSSNYAYIKFRSDFIISSKGFSLNYHTICHNNVTGSYGIIESPDFPNHYPINLHCMWTITVPLGNTINVTFSDFDISSNLFHDWRYTNFSRAEPFIFSRLCRHDYLDVKDPSDVHSMKRLCGSSIPAKISTKSNSLSIEFTSSSFITRKGFRLEWVKNGCGGHIQKNYGVINFETPQITTGPMVCEWIIETATGTGVTISFSNVYMSDKVNCSEDSIEVYNGPTAESPLIMKNCHQSFAMAEASTTNMILLRFTKYSNLRDVKFQSHFSSKPWTGCGGTIISHFGTISSINFPNNYDNNVDCMWTLEVPMNHRVEFSIIDLDLYFDEDSNVGDNSCGDSIKLYDGISFTSNYTQIICGNSDFRNFTSKSNILRVQFTSDGSGTAKGFKANFAVACGALISAKYSGTIRNDVVSHSEQNCTWTITAERPEEKVSLTLTHLSIPVSNEIQSNRHCPSTFLRILDGDDINAPKIDEYCGNKVPPMIVSHGSAITVQLGSYVGSVSGKFSAHYTTVETACGGELTSEQGSIATPNYPGSYPANTNCEWTLKTSPGNRVYITFERFNIEYSEGCNKDYLEVRENNGGGRLLGLYCGDDSPTNVTVASVMYLKFHSDGEDSTRGFILHYEFLHGNDITGKDYGEIASPLFPNSYEGACEYSWRITTSGSEPIILTIQRAEIPVRSLDCYNYLSIYDGFNDEAPLLKRICGIQKSITVKTSSNIAFIKLSLDETNTGSLFVMRWKKGDDASADTGNESEKLNCGLNSTKIILPGSDYEVNSPNFPKDYDDNLNCEWIFKATSGRHLSIKFNQLSIEEQSNCFADYISVFSSTDGTEIWKPVAEKICTGLPEYNLNFDSYMKVVFVTDISQTSRGFSAKVTSKCGGTVSSLSGVISPSWQDWNGEFNYLKTCNWRIKVRPGRTISLRFLDFNITNINNNCENYVLIRNGDSEEAPILGSGKYCGFTRLNPSDIISSSSNAVFITYKFKGPKFQNFRVRYEEENVECGSTSILDFNQKWQVINSPNYPSVPTPYSECVWVFKCPPGEIMSINFIDRFDLERNKDCTEEYVEIRDGPSAMSPRKGRYCDERPGTIKTTNNAVYIKYTTQIPNPRDGFKANVSIDVCGGTIIANNGEVSSPGYPHMTALPIGSVCEWKIIGYNGRVFKIRPQDIHLPDSEASCATKVTIEETLKVNNTRNILRTICNDDDDTSRMSIVESTLNEVVIKLYIGKPSEINSFSESRGFRFTFNSSRPTCGGSLSVSEGYLMTPAYPLYTTLRYCQWLITAPNKSRRIRLEIQDADFNLVKIGVFNDLRLQSSIKNTTEVNVFESSGNELAIYLWLFQSVTEHRFKAKFTSDEESLCGGSLSGTTGELFSPALERTYTCDWHYVNQRSIHNVQNSTINVEVTVNSSSSKTRCRYSDPKLIIKATIGPGLMFYRSLCGNMIQSYRIPTSNMDLRALQNERSSLNFHVSWKTQPCGGTVHVSQSDKNILNLPNNYNGTLDCAWLILVPFNSRVEMKLQGSFKLDCTKEFLQISQGLSDNPLILKEYCKDSTQETAFSVKFSFLYIQYHSESTNNDLKLLVSTKSNQCGGLLTKYENTFQSPNFPKNYIENQECVWEIKAEQGSRVSLQFVQRFVIEQRPNCTKDAVIIYDWQEGRYIEVAKLCGRELPHAYNSSGNRMKIILRTDSDINLDGFKAVWTPICGSNFNASAEEKFLYSPGYPFEYLSSLDCNYKISAPGQKIILKYLDLEVEGPYPQCEYDNLTITGSTGNEAIRFIYTFCGSNFYKNSDVFTDEVILEFKSDRYVQKKGFKLSYQIFSCGGHITTPTILKSHDDGEQYESNLNCTWLITAPKDKDVVLKFLYIDLEDSSDCSTDFVAVYNGRSIDETKRTALMCGHVNSSTVIKGNGNAMVLNFLSDFGLSYTGFKVEILFSLSKEAGCGGLVNVMAEGTQIIKSPLIGSNLLYENFLNCHWDIQAPPNRVIMVEFTKFHIAPCKNVNQTALGYSKCNCDMVEIRDGLNPNSLVIGVYCGHTLPPKLTSSGNFMSLRLYTDGDVSSSGFEARVSVREPTCGQSSYRLQSAVQTIKTPGFDKGLIPRGEHCVYLVYSVQALYLTSHIRIKSLDLQEGLQDKNVCDKDKLVITTMPSSFNDTLGKTFMLRRGGDEFFSNYYSMYQADLNLPESFVFCGKKSSVDLYVTGDVKISVQTSPESDNINHKGVELEINYGSYCPRNFSDTQGRISVIPTIVSDKQSRECFTLITAPENHTISVYLLTVSTSYWNDQVYFEILDGDKANDKRLLKIQSDYEDNTSVFSTGRHLLLHNHGVEGDLLTYDLIYMTTDKGPGCGGKLHSILGQVTSPMYPDVYRRIATCEWELETPVGSTLHLHFAVFDLGKLCEQNYVQLVNRKGQVISTYCLETPADYFSEDNYVKIVFKTTMNNAGTGWVAMFVGTK
ncbi:cubilin-like [Plutella xylostella]|uniref:cubilin-like n=1 Tax=Plutella xylostella TaxID=51655 RepID=UPI0020322BB2|nr:cubilin-like [Plutella xylostella]